MNYVEVKFKFILESFVFIASSAALWQFILFPLADTVNTKSSMSLLQHIYIIFGIGALVFLINRYSKKQGYLNWNNALSNSSTQRCILFCRINQRGVAIVLSIIYYKTKKVEVEIIVHYLMNLFIASLILWAMYKQCILETQKAIYYLYF